MYNPFHGKKKRSKSQEGRFLGVPDDLWESLNKEFHFTVDACASKVNAKCVRFWTKTDDGLTKDWDEEVLWCNPLFDRDIIKWIRKGLKAKNAIVVYLLPASTDSNWFSLIWDHERHQAKENVQVRFLKKRLKYKPAINKAHFASVVIVIRNGDPEVIIKSSKRNETQIIKNYKQIDLMEMFKIKEEEGDLEIK